MSKNPLQGVKGLAFDVFGTCVNWRDSVTKELHRGGQNAVAKASPGGAAVDKARAMTEADWEKIAEEWRATYYAFLKAQLQRPEGQRSKTVDEHHHEALVDLLKKHSLEGLFSEDEVHHLTMSWHRLDSWPDTNEALTKLGNSGYQTATLSNGNLSLLQDMQQHSGMTFTHTLSSETFGTFKPDPKMYLGAAAKMGLQAGQVAMVAAHLFDLKHAKSNGLKTVFVERFREDESDHDAARKEGYVDMWISIDEGGFEAITRVLCSA